MKEDILTNEDVLTDEEILEFWDMLFQQAEEEAALMEENDPLENCSYFTPEQGKTRIVGQKTSV